jgi:ankyrin repeat protein
MNIKQYFKCVAYLAVALSIFSANASSYDDYFRAINRGDARAVSALLQRGFDPNTRDEQGQAGLYLALRSESPATVQALWAHPELDINAANTFGETPLMMAALRGNLEWSRKLIERGAQVQKEGWAPLHYAACGPDVEVMRLLLDKGAAIDARSPNGDTPLMMAARYGSEASVDLLIARGANLKLRNGQGAGPADLARMDGRETLAARLERLLR